MGSRNKIKIKKTKGNESVDRKEAQQGTRKGNERTRAIKRRRSEPTGFAEQRPDPG
ncbi:hypothetical protein M413DRAFT_440679, partial [Hebeloma cylindrosporum]